MPNFIAEKCFSTTMNYRECHLFSFRLILLSAICGLAFFAISCGSSKDKFLTRGEEFLQKRKFHEAVMQFRAAADADKDSAAAHWGLARSYENLGQFYETVDELRKTVDLAPENLDARAKLGNYFLLVQPPLITEAEQTLQDILAHDANFIEGHILKASIFAAQKKSEAEVVQILDQAIAINPNRTESYLSKSRYFMTLGKAADAEDAIKKAIAVNPNAALGYVEYGRFLDYANRANEAEPQFKKAVEIDAKNIEAREAIAEFYVAQKQFEKAEQSYKDLVQVQENSPESRLSLANFYERSGREAEALATFNQILNDAPEYVRARYRLAEIELERKDYSEVRKQTEILLSINDNDTEALRLRARVNLQENKAEDAIKDLEEILKKQPSQKDALFYMAQARLALGQIDQARAFIGDLDKYHPTFLKSKLLKIQLAFSANDFENALRQANELIETAKSSFPNAETDAQDLMDLRVRGLSARGLAYLELGKIAEAKTDLQEIVKLSPNSSAALVNLAKISLAENNPSEALTIYEKALNADAKNFDALSGTVNVLVKQKQFAQAQAKIDKSLQENAGKNDVVAALHYLKSTVYTTEGNAVSAEESLKQAMAADANYLPSYSAYASVLAARNQTDEAVTQYQKVVEKKPSASVYTLLGMLEDGRGKASEAEKNYRSALEIQPESPIAANNLAWILAETGGNFDEALTLAQKSVNQIQTAGFYDTLGWVYFKKGLYSPAIEQLKKAVALDEMEAKKSGRAVNPAYRLRLGTALASSGDKLSAKKEVENSLQNAGNLSQKEAQEAKNLLASL
jgi:tetratricopeptide (TPR) repeat protein